MNSVRCLYVPTLQCCLSVIAESLVTLKPGTHYRVDGRLFTLPVFTGCDHGP